MWKRFTQTVVAALVLSVVAVFPAGPAAADVGEVYGPYFLVELNSSKCLDNPNSSTADNTTMLIYNCLGGANQRWYNEARSGSDYWTFNAASRKCLAVKNASRDDNAPILQFGCNNGTNERWLYQQVGTYPYGIVIGGRQYTSSGQFKIKNVNSSKCITVKNGSLDSGATLLQFDCSKPGSNIWVQFPI